MALVQAEDKYKVFWVDGGRFMQIYSTNDLDKAFLVGRLQKPKTLLLVIKEYDKEIYRDWI